jgi:hypothetical protein
MNHLVAFTLIALLCAPALAQTSKPTWQKSPLGELILRPFDSAPYPHQSRENGFKSKTTTYPAESHYMDSTVGIFIPEGYVPGDTVDYVVHFHGHNNHVSKVLPEYKLPEQLVASKVNAILIVPQGPKDAGDSGGGKLELDPGGFARLIADVTKYLNAEGKIHTSKVGKIALSAHSGGYKVTAAILHQGGIGGGMPDNITDVLLLDASYGSLEWFADWCKAGTSHRFVSLFTDHLAGENKEIMGLLDKAGVKYTTLDEATVTDEQFAARKPLFMHTKGPHDQVPVDYFGRLLKESALAKPAK